MKKIIFTVFVGGLFVFGSAYSAQAFTWTHVQHPTTNSSVVAFFVSRDGTKMVKGVDTTLSGSYSGYIPSTGEMYTSYDSGKTWTLRTSEFSPMFINGSADGTTIVAESWDSGMFSGNIPPGGYVYISKDSGATWIKQTTLGASFWYPAAVSADGKKIVLGNSRSGTISISNDGGATWTKKDVTGAAAQWSGVVSSADGTKLVGMSGITPTDSRDYAAATNYLYTSTDGGNSWTKRAGGGALTRWGTVASSDDGTKLIGIQAHDTVQGIISKVSVSTDSGVTWTLLKTPLTTCGNGTISPDGKSIAVICQRLDIPGEPGTSGVSWIYTSTDGGATWTKETSAGSHAWGYVAFLSGERILANAIDYKVTANVPFSFGDGSGTNGNASGTKQITALTDGAGLYTASMATSAGAPVSTSPSSANSQSAQTAAPQQTQNTTSGESAVSAAPNAQVQANAEMNAPTPAAQTPVQTPKVGFWQKVKNFFARFF